MDFVCISLDFRKDRRDRIKPFFSRLGILDQVNWWIVQKHPSGGIYGCFESHYSVWNNQEFTKPYLCVFEDDITEINETSRERFTHLLANIKETDLYGYDFINLEPKLGYITRKVTDNIFEGYFLDLGCYLIKRAAIPRISANIRNLYGMDVDIALYNACRYLGVFPQIFQQYENDSDNTGGHRDLCLYHPEMSRIFRKIIQKMPFLGWVTMEWAWLGGLYLIRNKAQPELIDRRLTL